MKNVEVKISEISVSENVAVILVYYNDERIGGGYTTFTANSTGHVDSTWLNNFVQGQVNTYNRSLANNNMVVHT
jgi:endoglucanase Acf2